MSLSDDLRSIPALFGDAIDQLAKLVSNEIRLARAEISEKAQVAATGVTYLAGTGILMIPGLVLLLLALAAWLVDQGMSQAAGYGVVGGIAIVLSLALAFAGLSKLKAKTLAPSVTIRQVESDIAAAKEVTR